MFSGSIPRIATLLASFFVSLAMSCQLAAKEVSLTNKDGKSITARMITCQGDKLTVLRSSDKKQFDLSIAQLDDASRAEVDAWLKAGGGLSERFEVDVRSGKRQRSTGYDNSEEKRVDIEPLVVIKNPQANIRTRAVKVTVLILGRPVVLRNAYHVFSVKSFNLPSMEGGKEGLLQMERISHVFDDSGGYKRGARYLGWVVVIQDPEDGRIIHSQSIPEPLSAKFGRQFLKLESDQTYDDNLKLVKNFSITSG
jgi:hypothetical protein